MNDPTAQLHRSGRDVLVVEDEDRVRKMLAQALAVMGFQPTFAGSAEAAARAIANHTFDILILDLNLPGQNGIDFLEQVRRKDPDVQAIILTGFGDLEVAKKAIRLDVADFLTKPCALGQLEQALARAAARQKGRLVEAAAAAQPTSEPSPAFHVARPDLATSSPTASMEAIEQDHILAALTRNRGNRAATAAELGISVRKLYYRLGEYQKRGLIP